MLFQDLLHNCEGLHTLILYLNCLHVYFVQIMRDFHSLSNMFSSPLVLRGFHHWDLVVLKSLILHSIVKILWQECLHVHFSCVCQPNTLTSLMSFKKK